MGNGGAGHKTGRGAGVQEERHSLGVNKVTVSGWGVSVVSWGSSRDAHNEADCFFISLK